MKIVVLVPTRNRSDLARRAAGSALAQRMPGPAQVVLSDNSDDAAQAGALQEWSQAQANDQLAYIRPAQPLNMGDHWHWAIGECLRRFAPTHLVVLTDRMVFRGQALAEVAPIAQCHPGLAVSFMHDRINDLETPVALERHRWSGAVCAISSRHLLDLSARCVFHDSLPRILNTLVPVAALERVHAAYGDYCRAVSPDFGFAYRYLATHPEFVFYDKALLVNYAIARSNGASTTRGVLSKDAQNFRRVSLGGQDRLPHAPYPEFLTLGNFIMEEYCFARAGLPAAGLAEVDHKAYVRMLFTDSADLEDPAARAPLYAMLEARGHAGDLLALRLRKGWKRRTKGVEQAFKRAFGGKGRVSPPRLTFPSIDEALAYNATEHAQRLPGVAHLGVIAPRVLDAQA